MNKRSTKRPETFKKPEHWSNDPVPARGKKAAEKANVAPKEELSPTRYGDWVRDGIAVDF